jgi:hypothetical protein
MSKMSNVESTHESRYSKKKRAAPSPNSICGIAELGDDGIWRMNGQPYRAPRAVRYGGKTGPGGRDVFRDKVTGELA